MNDWLDCKDVALIYEVLAFSDAVEAWRSGRQAAKEVAGTIASETAHLRR